MKERKPSLDHNPGIESLTGTAPSLAQPGIETGRIKTDSNLESAALPMPRPNFAQTRLWFWDQLHPGRTVYNIPTATRLGGPLDLDALQLALTEVFRRHDSLRAFFPDENGTPQLRIAEHRPVQLNVTELTAMPGSERELEWRRRWDAEFNHCFDLRHGPLVRFQLIRISPEDHLLLWNAHHIIYDMWSHSVFLRELAAVYGAYRSGSGLSTSATPLSCVEYARRQRMELSPERQQAALKFWCEQLAGAPLRLNLPRDLAATEAREFDGGCEAIELNADLAEALRRCARKEGVTLYALLLSAFGSLLHRYSGQNDFVIGVPITTRDHIETEDAIGLFLNTLVMRIRIFADLTFRQLLKQVRATIFDAFDHRELPFEKLVEALRPDRRLQADPLFQVMFDYQAVYPRACEGGGVRFLPLETQTRTAKYDLTLLMKEREQMLMADLEYNAGLFERTTAVRMLEHFRVMLEGIVADPDCAIAALPMPTESERQQVTITWNRTGTDYPAAASIVDLFEQEVEQAPQRPAVIYEHRPDCRCGCLKGVTTAAPPLRETLSYHELNARANRLAHRLQSLGVAPETRIGICLDRSMELIVSLVGILKAGGVYVPLDPGYPDERLAYMVADANCRFVVAPRHQAERIEKAGARCVPVEEDDGNWPETNPARRTASDQLAYVMYTSGSTGTPKGVPAPHRGVVRLVRNTNYISPATDDVFLHMAPLTFDASTFEIWAPLLNGARLVLMPPNPVSLEEIGCALRRFHVTDLWLTSGLFHLMVDERPRDLSGLRRVFTGGDVLSISRVEQFFREVPGVELVNCYGPTENTTFTTWYRIPPGPVRSTSIPIGKPISNTRVYILDESMQPAPIGVPGELYIAGDGLAREYLNATELTQEKFVAAPSALALESRLYKTGDLARYLVDGNIEFLGRKDHQVKIRGFRIELGEIETALARHPSVRESVVLVRGDTADAKELVAYWTSRTAPPPSDDLLRNFLRSCLPDYMVPTVWMRLERLPLTENGKVDRRALPSPAEARSEQNIAVRDRNCAEPRNPTERSLLGLWCELLELNGAGVHDNFFSMGGHSLLATRLAARISAAFGVDLPLRAIFEKPTIAGLAESIAELPVRTGGYAPIQRRRQKADAAKTRATAGREESLDRLRRTSAEPKCSV